MPQFDGDSQNSGASQRKAAPKEIGPELMAGLAHTVQTPLQSVIINSEMLLEILRASSDAKVRDKGSRIVSRILREAVSLQSIVRDFLALSRISVGKKLPTDVNSIIREVVEFVRNECLAAGIDIALSLDTSIYPVLVDRSLFSHALMNLIRNARESIGSDGIIEVVSREREDFLEIEVRDDGKGMLEENAERIFEPFFSTKPGGTGLGLPIARKIAEMHGGTIFVRPEPGRGSVFVIQLSRGRFIDSPASSKREWSVE
jgi:signal transduction histidine kinase